MNNTIQEIKNLSDSIKFEIEDMQVQRLVLQEKCELLAKQRARLERIIDDNDEVT